ncbi:hypothetical protein RQP46_007922 [Phenoliferia psychrophenolica]
MRGTRLVNAVIGCYIDESAIVGSKLVQFDLLTLQPSTIYFDRPLTEYHLPFYRQQVLVRKSASPGLFGDSNSGATTWAERCVEIDGMAGTILILKSLEDSTISSTFHLPVLSLALSPSSPQLLTLKFANKRGLVLRPKNERSLRDLVRILSPATESGPLGEMCEEEESDEWRINDIVLLVMIPRSLPFLNFFLASSSLSFQVSILLWLPGYEEVLKSSITQLMVLYPWHLTLDESFIALKARAILADANSK